MRLLHNRTPGRQTGAALAVSLVILLIMTILGVQALKTTMLEEKMAGNYRDKQLAFEAAEAALREAEIWLDTITPTVTVAPFTPDLSNGEVWMFSDVMQENIKKEAWWNSPSGVVEATTNNSQLSSEPKYTIMEQQSLGDTAELGSNAQQPQRYFYRVVARGVGGSDNSVVLLQTTFVKLY